MYNHGDITVGIDLIEIDRVQNALDRWGDRFLNRIYTTGEIDYCNGRAERLAARFAAKEATMKALGTGIRGISWCEIEVSREKGQPPKLTLHGRTAGVATDAGITDLALSLSHSKAYAVACVIGRVG
jgi:holo-[acyl-carrier protein] synthase